MAIDFTWIDGGFILCYECRRKVFVPTYLLEKGRECGDQTIRCTCGHCKHTNQEAISRAEGQSAKELRRIVINK